MCSDAQVILMPGGIALIIIVVAMLSVVIGTVLHALIRR